METAPYTTRPHKMAGHHIKLTDKRLCNGHGLDAERYTTHLRLECESVGRGGHSDRDLLNTIWTVNGGHEVLMVMVLSLSNLAQSIFNICVVQFQLPIYSMPPP